MSSYLLNFLVYTAAMVGVIYLAVIVYKKSTSGLRTSKSKFISVEESLNISPRKTLYVVRAGNEQFLIAGDADKTTLISQLGNSHAATRNIYPRERVDLPDITQELPNVVEFQQMRDDRATGILKRIVNI